MRPVLGDPALIKLVMPMVDTTAQADAQPCLLVQAETTVALANLDAGALFVAVGVDTTLLAKGAQALLQAFRVRAGGAPPAAVSAY